MKRCIFIIPLLLWHVMAMADVTLKIDPPQARPGETILLTLTLDGASTSGVPDLTPLEKDFTIVGTEHNMSYTATNGVAKVSSQWIALIIAKKSGVITIPPIRIGNELSNPEQVTITATAKARKSKPAPDTLTTLPEENDDEVMLRAELNQQKPLINQQVTYTVKLYSRTPVMNATYQPPRIEDALIIPLGDGRRYQTTINGNEYAVDEQQYAIFSQKSGELNISPPQFNALVYGAVPRQIHVNGPTLKLDVKPIPQQDANQQWLPAKQVALTEQYDPLATTFTQGNTLTRTITLQVMGMPAELLPTLEFPDNKQFSTYPERTQTKNTLRHQELVGTSKTKVTYLLNQAGSITLPEIKLTWFNTETGKHEITTLPEREIRVTGTGLAAPSTPTVQASSTQPAHETSPSKTTTTTPNSSHQLAWWIAGGFALAWALTVALWWFRPNSAPATQQTMRAVLKQLQDACVKNDPTQARIALLHWGKLQWAHAVLLNINEIGLQVRDVVLKNQIERLSQALYGQQGQPSWQGDGLWRAVKGYHDVKSTKTNPRDDLPPMNPL